MWWRLRAVALLAVIMEGCATVSAVTLRHPETGHTVRCEGYWHWNLNTREAREQELRQQGCIEDYQRQGYVRVP